ncbi:hypothetical protein F5050DRAFT_1904084 [Lentinula boryana]|uniref:Uncharacterized protein n=1 Tax=Lentinula boryana TaxID=40481 RepID=A0ABQ8Q7N0_9AGAR|nr:hypothetical protein F5050DRAFT_1904084 [Lentinula boryana]
MKNERLPVADAELAEAKASAPVLVSVMVTSLSQIEKILLKVTQSWITIDPLPHPTDLSMQPVFTAYSKITYSSERESEELLLLVFDEKVEDEGGAATVSSQSLIIKLISIPPLLSIVPILRFRSDNVRKDGEILTALAKTSRAPDVSVTESRVRDTSEKDALEFEGNSEERSRSLERSRRTTKPVAAPPPPIPQSSSASNCHSSTLQRVEATERYKEHRLALGMSCSKRNACKIKCFAMVDDLDADT